MINVKAISISAICGFVLSFIFGLFSHSKFYMILIKALIFALIFGAIGLLISFLYKKFLAGDSSNEFSSGNEGEASANAAPVKGQRVNLVVEDQEFERGDSDNHFVVGENHQMLNESDYGKSEHGAADSNPSFVPLRNHETVENISGKEAAINDAIPTIQNTSTESSKPSANSGIPTLQDESSGGLDVLPDMDNLTADSNVITATESSSSSEENAGFGTEEGFSSVSSSRSKKVEPEVQDAGIMAKAISSILSGEE